MGARSCTLLPFAAVICMLLAAVLGIRAQLQHANVFSGTEVAYRGMADAFAGVVIALLRVAAGVFARGG